MCYFISVGLSAKAQQKWIGLLPQKMKGFPVVTVVTEMCSCDLYSPNSIGDVAKIDGKKLKAYESKGWSQSKIARAVEGRKESGLAVNLHPDFRRWLADASADAKEAYLFVHWDLAKIDSEFKVTLSVEEFCNEQTHIADEHLIHIKAH